jgi:integrase/recombinase XerC
MISQFNNWLTFEKRYSSHTISSYMSDLNQYCLFLKVKYTDTEPESTSKQMIKSWVIDLMDRGLSPLSVDRKIVALRAYFRFLVKEGKIEKNPAIHIKPPKKGKRIVKFLEEEEIIKVLDDIDYPDDYEGKRDRLILEMLYGTGIRLSELTGLKMKNIDLKTGLIKVLGKRNKERIIPINNTLKIKISDYLQSRDLFMEGLSSEHFFLTDKMNSLYPMLVYRVVKNYMEKYISRTSVSPHVLRHTFATHLINRGADINSIKELLGHANLAATQIYTHTTIERLKNVYKQAHPRG